MRRIPKKTQGQRLQAFISGSATYTNRSTIAGFAANAAEGEIGIFKNSDNTQYTGAVAVGDIFYIAQKVDGDVKRSVNITGAAGIVRIKDYVAPIKQVTYIGYDGTDGQIYNPSIAARQHFELSIKETTPLYQPFPTWNYEVETISSSTLYTTLSALAAKMNNVYALENKGNGVIVKAEVVSDGTFAEFDNDPTLVNGSTTVTFASDSSYGGGSTALVVGDMVRFRSVTYRVVTVTSSTSVELDRPYTGVSETIDSSVETDLGGRLTVITATNYGLKLTAFYFESHFRVSVKQELKDASIQYNTTYKAGNGTSAKVQDLEKESQVGDGYTSGNAAFAEDWGKPTSFASTTLNYNLYFIDSRKVEVSTAAPLAETVQYNNFVIAAQLDTSDGDTDLVTDLETIFGSID